MATKIQTDIQTDIEAAIEEITPSPDCESPAILRCCSAWLQTFENSLTRGRSPVSARLRANEAYRRSLPALAGSGNISEFVACVAYGLAMRTIIHPQATALLYAAQVAISACKPNGMKDIRPRSREKGTPPPSFETAKLALTA